MSIRVQSDERIAKIESIIENINSDTLEVQQEALVIAQEENNEEMASELARKIRNKLLEESDKEVVLDRINLDISSTTAFIKSLKELLTGDWVKYRQQLRDIPEQQGFPFKITFPEAPNRINKQ